MTETQTTLLEPSVEEPAVQLAPTADGSPSAVEQQEIALIRRHAELNDALPEMKAIEAAAIEQRRTAMAEMAVIERLLRAHKRIKSPRKRT